MIWITMHDADDLVTVGAGPHAVITAVEGTLKVVTPHPVRHYDRMAQKCETPVLAREAHRDIVHAMIMGDRHVDVTKYAKGGQQ